MERIGVYTEYPKLLSEAREAAWLVCGDFNEVRDKDERFNCEFIEARAKRLNDFISCNNLLEIPLGGRMFTRVSDDGVKFSKLDRFLASEKFCHYWKSVSATALDKKHSDHCPIMLTNEEKNFGPKSFKIFDVWLDEDDIDQVIVEAWKEPVANINRKDCIFRNKLEVVKDMLRSWSNRKFGQIEGEIETFKELANSLELKTEGVILDDNEEKLWKESRKMWFEKETIKSKMLQQKARVHWILDGDENTKYFHSILKRKNTTNNIRGLDVDGVWIDCPNDIKDAVFRHFKQIFTKRTMESPSLEELRYPTLNSDNAAMLEMRFSEKEIHDAIMECGSTKAPGPDGFNMRDSASCSLSAAIYLLYPGALPS
ncbi:uncharacterized protein [Rutidosis leptorrhynchoides]|uniref:uncharacterized protein n=1 Tax=Rutidosis leptorrhynchoides TaxID=125765 RepID=UPI003A99D454